MTQKAAKLFKINAFLFIVAIAVSGYLVWHHYELINGNAGFGSFCSINQTVDCDVVNTSQYSEINGIPIATVAFSYYILAFMLSLIGALHAYWRREAALLLGVLSLGSLGATIITLSIMAVRLKAFCLMCGSLDILNILTCIISIWAARSLSIEAKQIDRKRILGFIAAGVAIFTIAQASTMQLEDKTPFDQEMFLTILRAQNVQNIDPGNSPRQGFQGDNPQLRLVEFADFECPHCSIAARLMHRLLKIYGDKVQLVFKNYPLDMACNPHIQQPMHENSCTAAKATVCAQQQGKFEELYEKMFSNQSQVSYDNIMIWIREFGMNPETFSLCMQAAETTAAVLRDIDQATTLGLSSTPTFFANGRKIEGAIDETRLKLILKELRK